MRRAIILGISLILLNGCDPRRPVTGTLSLEPSERQQLYTVDYGPLRAVQFFCPVDTSALAPSVSGLAPDSVQVGYESTEVPSDVRRRCRRDRNFEHHSWLAFDLSATPAPAGVLYHATLSGRAELDPANLNCPSRGDPPFGGFLAGINVAPQFRVEPSSADTPQEAAPTDIDGELIPFRTRELELAAGDTSGRIGSPPLFVFEIERARLDYLARRVRGRIESDEPAVVTFIGAQNPDITGERVCLERLTDIRLNLIFRAP